MVRGAGVGAGMALVLYLAAVGLSLVSGGDAPLTPWTSVGGGTSGDLDVNSRNSPARPGGPSGGPPSRSRTGTLPSGGTSPDGPLPGGGALPSVPGAPAQPTAGPTAAPTSGPTATPSVPPATATPTPPGNGKSQASPRANGRTNNPNRTP